MSKIPWVNWDNVCKPKRREEGGGGIGVRDLWLVNYAILENWRWRLIVGDLRLWIDIMISIYRDISFPISILR